MRNQLALASFLLAFSAPAVAQAQEIHLTGPLRGCIAILVRYETPAEVEWSYWVSAGVASLHGRAGTTVGAEGGVGAEVTGRLRDWRGPEAFRRRWGAPDPDLRGGLWGGAATRSSGSLLEGGGVLRLGSLTAFTAELRLGGGYGAFPDGRAPHAAATLALGLHLVPVRYTVGGACDPPVIPEHFGEESAVRLATTLRRAASGAGWEITAGVEITPTAALLPWTMRWRRR